MSNFNYIVELLGLKEKGFILNENIISYKTKNKVRYRVLHASLTDTPTHCSRCGSINENHSIIKHGFKSSVITIGDINHQPSLLQLKKQRFLCKSCSHTFTVSSTIVDAHCFISNNVKHKIALDARKKRSEKDIAMDNHVSHATVNAIIHSFESSFKIKRSYLPDHLSFDEFKATKRTLGKMAFIMINAKTSEVIDIVENRQLHHLLKYFRLYSYKARCRVKTITIDMYTPYIHVITSMFPNAKIIIDKFHIVQLLSRSLNQTRIDVMKRNKKYYNKLKRYWKLILTDRDHLNNKEFKKYRCFPTLMREIDIVDSLLLLDSTFRDTYDLYQAILSAIKHKRYDALEELLNQNTDTLSSYMKTSIKTLIKYQKYLKNTFLYPYSNGRIEGINNIIKVIKRIAFGYRHFSHLKTRVLMIVRSPLHINVA